jgi:hypothetical protein
MTQAVAYTVDASRASPPVVEKIATPAPIEVSAAVPASTGPAAEDAAGPVASPGVGAAPATAEEGIVPVDPGDLPAGTVPPSDAPPVAVPAEAAAPVPVAPPIRPYLHRFVNVERSPGYGGHEQRRVLVLLADGHFKLAFTEPAHGPHRRGALEVHLVEGTWSAVPGELRLAFDCGSRDRARITAAEGGLVLVLDGARWEEEP